MSEVSATASCAGRPALVTQNPGEHSTGKRRIGPTDGADVVAMGAVRHTVDIAATERTRMPVPRPSRRAAKHGVWVAVAGLLAACSGGSSAADDTVVTAAESTATADAATAPTGGPTTTTVGASTSEPPTPMTSPPTTTPTPSSTTAPTISCALAAGETTRVHNGVDRVVLFEPAVVVEPAPVLVLFHGFAGIAESFAANTGLSTEAPAAGIHLVVPVGLGSPATWELPGGTNDDVGFVSALLDDLVADPCIDPDRIWLAGYSAGAGFVGTFACDAWERLDGIVMNAAVAPPLCEGFAGFDVIAAHGTADRVVAYDGLEIGEGEDAVTLPSSSDLVAEWALRLDCTGPTETVDGALTRQRWDGCGAEANTVDMLTYVDGAHRWPGRDAVGGEGMVVAEPDLTCVVLAAIAGEADAIATC